MLRVLTLSTLYPDAGRPGFGRFVERQTQALAAQPGIAVEVVSPRGLPPGPLARLPGYRAIAALPECEQRGGLTIHRPRFPILPRLSGAWNARLLARALRPVLTALRRDFAFDVIDAEFFYPDGPAALALGALFGVPVSIKARGSDIHYWAGRPAVARQIAAAARGADGLLAVSAAIAAELIALGAAPARVAVHYTGIDLALFQPADRAALQAGLGIAGPLIASVGALTANKGQALLIDMLPLLPAATLILAGDGPERAALGARAAERGVAARVRLSGALPPAAVAELLAAADVMALPSAAEGLANAWIEALACGTPIVIPPVGGAAEVVDRPAAGRITAREPGAIAAAIAALLADPPDAPAVRAVAERFSWERNGRELAAHLRRLVAARTA